MKNIVRNVKGKTFEINIDELLKNGYDMEKAHNYVDTYINFVLNDMDLSEFTEDKVYIVL